jgi:hypothetical protein
MTRFFLPSRSAELHAVENARQHLLPDWLAKRVLETCDVVVDAACDAWDKLAIAAEVFTSIAMREQACFDHS